MNPIKLLPTLVVGIRVESENVISGEKKHTNTSYFTMVAKDMEGKLCEVPPLELENDEDVRRCLEAIKRKRLKAAFSDEFDNEKNRLDLAENVHLLKNERVVFESKEKAL